MPQRKARPRCRESGDRPTTITSMIRTSQDASQGRLIVPMSLGVLGVLGLVVASAGYQGQPLPSRTVATSSEPWGKGRKSSASVLVK
jgi:hypothetical protein